VAATVDGFGRLDVLVNNAGNFQAGFFEEMTPEAFRSQIDTTLFGPVNVTRAAPPQIRGQRSGLVMTIPSTAGITSPVELRPHTGAGRLPCRRDHILALGRFRPRRRCQPQGWGTYRGNSFMCPFVCAPPRRVVPITTAREGPRWNLYRRRAPRCRT
jgi:NAD(P)-dependent dehydrogenase (short-subunit alcohol dehydrogenase family)